MITAGLSHGVDALAWPLLSRWLLRPQAPRRPATARPQRCPPNGIDAPSLLLWRHQCSIVVVCGPGSGVFGRGWRGGCGGRGIREREAGDPAADAARRVTWARRRDAYGLITSAPYASRCHTVAVTEPAGRGA